MDKGSILTKLQTLTLEEKLTLLSDTDKAYIQNYLNQAVPEFWSQEQSLQAKTTGKRSEKRNNPWTQSGT